MCVFWFIQKTKPSSGLTSQMLKGKGVKANPQGIAQAIVGSVPANDIIEKVDAKGDTHRGRCCQENCVLTG